MTSPRRLFGSFVVACALIAASSPARADEIWVPPSSQQDLGGLEVASNTFWPVTPAGAVRLAWAAPNNLQAFQSAKVVLIPGSPAGNTNVNLYVCAAQSGNSAVAGCAGPFAQPFTGVANQLIEVEIGPAIASRVGAPGANYLTVLAYTSPTTTTDHIVGMRFAYTPTAPSGAATLSANTFTGTQTAPAFVGNGSGLTNLPIPAGAATLGANTFSGTQTAPAFAGNGAGLTSLPFPAGAASLGSNTFNGTQTVTFGNIALTTGNLDLPSSNPGTGIIMKNGTPFLHNFGVANTFLGVNAGNFTMTGGGNTVFGAGAFRANTTGFQNTASGVDALGFNSTGQGNTASGVTALGFNSTGANNVAVGFFAGIEATTGSNNIYLGASVRGVAGESNTIYLGKQGTQTRTVIAGIRSVTTGVADAVPVFIDSNGQLGTASSSIRFKEDIHDMAGASQRLFNLRPVTFRYTQAYIDGGKPTQYGLIAEEVAEVFPELAVRDADGQVETVHYETLNVLLLNELKKEHEEVQRQRRRIDLLEQKLEDLLTERRAVPARVTR
jgi:hypothetical protein